MRLERFREGKLDRWGRPVTRLTPPGDFYVERRDQDDEGQRGVRAARRTLAAEAG